MIVGNFSSTAHELEKKYGLEYLIKNYKRSDVSEAFWDIKENSFGDTDFLIKRKDWTIERIQIKTHPTTQQNWSVNNTEFKKGFVQLLANYIDDENNSNFINNVSYTLFLEGEHVRSNYGQLLTKFSTNFDAHITMSDVDFDPENKSAIQGDSVRVLKH